MDTRTTDMAMILAGVAFVAPSCNSRWHRPGAIGRTAHFGPYVRCGTALFCIRVMASFAITEVALGFIDAVERAISQISRSGSLRFSYELGIPHLRARPLDRFPYLVFYVAANPSSRFGASCTHGETFQERMSTSSACEVPPHFLAQNATDHRGPCVIARVPR
jgi:hypothetical protein